MRWLAVACLLGLVLAGCGGPDPTTRRTETGTGSSTTTGTATATTTATGTQASVPPTATATGTGTTSKPPVGPQFPTHWLQQEGNAAAIPTGPWDPLDCDSSGIVTAMVERASLDWVDANATMRAVHDVLGLSVKNGSFVQKTPKSWTWQIKGGGQFSFFGESEDSMFWTLPRAAWDFDTTAEAKARFQALAAALPWRADLHLEGNVTPVPESAGGNFMGARLEQHFQGDFLRTVASVTQAGGGMVSVAVTAALDLPASSTLIGTGSLVGRSNAYATCMGEALDGAPFQTILVQRGGRMVWSLTFDGTKSNQLTFEYDAVTGAQVGYQNTIVSRP